jgi:Ctr copper transporter family
MVFFTSTSTPLYSLSWTPTSTGQYAGSCIFLIVLAVVFRSLLFFKARLEQKWLVAEMRRQYIFDSGRVQVKRDMTGGGNTRGTPDAAIVDKDVIVARNAGSAVRPWRISTDGPRAVVDTIIVGVGYLL